MNTPKLPECKNPAMVSHTVKGSPCSQEGAKRKAECPFVVKQKVGSCVSSQFSTLPAISGGKKSTMRWALSRTPLLSLQGSIHRGDQK